MFHEHLYKFIIMHPLISGEAEHLFFFLGGDGCLSVGWLLCSGCGELLAEFHRRYLDPTTGDATWPRRG